jgi:hypothetical protein
MSGEGERVVERVLRPREVMEGAGVMVRRALPSNEIPYSEVDPFLLLDVFDTSAAGSEGAHFPLHPHRGFEIITYLLAGAAGHADDLGNKEVVRGGGLQKITAGRGIWHEEKVLSDDGEPARGLQLWINLARRDKGLDPEYQALAPDEVPTRDRKGAKVRVLVGPESPVRLRTPALYLDVTLSPGGVFEEPLRTDHNAFVFVIEGEGAFGANGKAAAEGLLLVLGRGGGLRAEASPGGVRFVLGAGKPHGEPVQWRGSFVD